MNRLKVNETMAAQGPRPKSKLELDHPVESGRIIERLMGVSARLTNALGQLENMDIVFQGETVGASAVESTPSTNLVSLVDRLERDAEMIVKKIAYLQDTL